MSNGLNIKKLITTLKKNPDAFNQTRNIFWFYSSLAGRFSLTKIKVDGEGYWNELVKIQSSVKRSRVGNNTTMPMEAFKITPDIDGNNDWDLLLKEVKKTVGGKDICENLMQ